MLYGFPGAGKTYFARQLSEKIGAVHLHSDRFRNELFEHPRFDNQEDDIIDHLMQFMAAEFLNAGVSIIYDGNAKRLINRRALRDLARKSGAKQQLIWLQIDPESAMSRLNSRDKRTNDDKYAVDYSKSSFDDHASMMQNPNNEDYMVISGKHTFKTQQGAVIKKLYDMSLINSSATAKIIKPGLVNLIPTPRAGRVDLSRRNIVIR